MKKKYFFNMKKVEDSYWSMHIDIGRLNVTKLFWLASVAQDNICSLSITGTMKYCEGWNTIQPN